MASCGNVWSSVFSTLSGGEAQQHGRQQAILVWIVDQMLFIAARCSSSSSSSS